MQLKSQEMRKLAPELDPLRIGTGWKKEDLGKVQVMVEMCIRDRGMLAQSCFHVGFHCQTKDTGIKACLLYTSRQSFLTDFPSVKSGRGWA